MFKEDVYIFLIKHVQKVYGSRPGHVKRMYGRFLIKYVLKVQGFRPASSKLIATYIHWKLKDLDREFQSGSMYELLIIHVMKA